MGLLGCQARHTVRNCATESLSSVNDVYSAGTATDLPAVAELSSPSESLERIQEVNEAYAQLERHRTDAREILERKFAVAFWRMQFLKDLLHGDPVWLRNDQEGLVEILSELKIYVPADLQAQLSESIRDKDLLALVMARQGVRAGSFQEFSTKAGPGVDLKITANRSSAWPFEKWRNIREFSEYEFEGDGVHYRGVFFRPGDIVLSNVNLDGNGLYTALADPQNFCSHSAIFAILQDKERRFPALIETFEKGVRAVPLNVFLGPRFSSYTEVYRHRELGAGQVERVTQAAIEATRNVRGYNFDTEDRDRTYMSCSSVGRFLLQDAGLDRIQTKSHIRHPQIQKNLGQLGYTFFRFFAPVDYLLDEKLSFIGWIDNNQFDRLLARELIESHFRNIFSEKEISVEKFPFMSRVNYWGIGQMRRRTPIGKIITLVEGFDHANLPKGPDRLLSVITQAEAQIGSAIRRTRPFVRDYIAGLSSFDLEHVKSDEDIRKIVDNNLRLPWLS